MITLKNIFSGDNLIDQYKKAVRGKRYHLNVIRYNEHALTNLLVLHNKIMSETYVPKPDHSFVVYEPKKRIITANAFEDKIVQGLLIDNAIIPAVDPKLIYDNYASRKGMGTKKALDRLDEFLHAYYINHGSNKGYVLRCDIRKYFYSINIPIVHQMIDRLPFDKRLKNLLFTEIRPWDQVDTGVCIGHELSQWIAIFYLNSIDHMIKEKFKIKYYGRFMDDFYLVHENRDHLKECLYAIAEKLSELKLELNEKTQLYPLRDGIKFLGFHTYLTETGKVKKVLLQPSIKRMHKRMFKYRTLIEQGILNIEDVLNGFTAWKAHAIQGNSLKILYWMDIEFFNLFHDILEYFNIPFWEYCYLPGRFENGGRVKEKDIIWAKERFSFNKQ